LSVEDRRAVAVDASVILAVVDAEEE